MIASAVTAIGLAAAVGTGVVSAQSQSSGTGLVDKIAQKFNLNKADVQAVFDQNRKDHEAQRQQDMKSKLDQAVKDGKLTQDQEDKLVAKFKEMDSYRDSLKDKTEDERHTAMKTKMDEFKQWLKDNNISEDLVRLGGPHGHGGPRGEGGMPSQ